MNASGVRRHEVKKNGFDMEKIVIILTMACMTALGTVLLLCGLLQIEIVKQDFMTFMGLVAGLSGIYFGLFLLFQDRK